MNSFLLEASWEKSVLFARNNEEASRSRAPVYATRLHAAEAIVHLVPPLCAAREH